MTRQRKNVGLIVAGVLIIGAALAFTTFRAGPPTTTVTAVFTDASPILPGFTVRSNGVKVGEIDSIGVRGGRAWVRMSIQDGAALPLHADATARIRPVSLLGERYIDFNRGSANAPLASPDAPIPVTRTASAVDLSDVLNAVDNPTGASLGAFLTTLGEGQRGRGPDIAATMAELGPSLTRTDDLVTMLNQQNDTLNELIDRAAPVSRALAANNGQDLDRLLSSMEGLLRVTASNQPALDASLTQLPGTLTNARATLARLAGVSQEGTETLGRLRPFTDDLPAITVELSDFTDAADPALDSLDPLLRRARELVDQAAPLARTLHDAGPDLRTVSKSARPLVSRLGEHLDDVLEFVKDWALSTNGHDGLTNYFRGAAIVDPDSGTGLAPGGTPAPLAALTHPERKPVKPLPLMGDTDPGNATGLTPPQEQNMVSQLIGGR